MIDWMSDDSWSHESAHQEVFFKGSVEDYFNMVKDHPLKQPNTCCQNVIQATKMKVTLFCSLRRDSSLPTSCFNPL